MLDREKAEGAGRERETERKRKRKRKRKREREREKNKNKEKVRKKDYQKSFPAADLLTCVRRSAKASRARVRVSRPTKNS